MPVFLEPQQEGRRIVLDKAIVFIGRHPDCDVVLSRSRKVSRKHCCIAQVNNQFHIRDLGSMNGVRVNGKRIEKVSPLKPGDAVAIGDCTYTVKAEGAQRPPKKGGAKIGEVARPRPRSQPVDSADLSKNFPVPVPEAGDQMPGNRDVSIPLQEDGKDDEIVELDEDIDDIQLDDEAQREDRGSHFEFSKDFPSG